MELEDQSSLENLKKANLAFRAGNYATALNYYQALLSDSGVLEKHLQFNLRVTRKHYEAQNAPSTEAKLVTAAISPALDISAQKKSNLISPSIFTPNKYIKPKNEATNDQSILKTKLKIVVVLHIYHADVVDLCLESISYIPYDFDIIVTTPLSPDNAAIHSVKTLFPRAEILFFENAGRDIGPFIQVWSKIKKYDICCKVHTKKGVSDYIDSWRDLCIQGILHSPNQITGIIRAFEKDKKIAIAGPELLYGSYESLIGNNRKNVSDLFEKVALSPAANENNGFFMGTMFWFRTSSFSFINKLQSVVFTPEAAQKDGMVEHAIERIFGSVLLENQKVLLTRVNDKHVFSSKVVPSNYKSLVDTFHKHFDLLNYSHQNIKQVVGHIFTGAEVDRSLSGWLALKGNGAPREAIVMIDGIFELDMVCDRYRGDLERNNINKGFHAFQLTIPFEFMDGQEHTFILIDKLTGKTVSSTTKVKNRISDIDVIRSYPEWDKDREVNFLKTLDKFSNIIPENTFASIIMPTYNRADKIANAVNSVLMQSFRNFELLIIDDGSTDDTKDLIAQCYNDERIVFIASENQGVSHARNIGLGRAKGNYIFFLDSDNTWNVNFLTNMIRYIHNNNIDSAYCGLMAVDDMKSKTHFKGCDFSWNECVQSNYVDLNTFGFKRTGINPPFLFNETLKRLVDWDYILKFAQFKAISYAPFLGVNYYDGDTARITNTVYRSGEELTAIVKSIKDTFTTFVRGVDDRDYIAEHLFRHRLLNQSKKSAPTVTTMITTYNHQNYIAEAIESVLCQVGNFRHKIIISDDGSTDNTRDIIKKYSDLYPDLITDLSSEKNVGLSNNMRRCIKATNSKYVAMCEGDDFWTDSRKLAKTVDFLEKHTDHSMVFSQILVMNVTKGKFEILPRQENLKGSRLNGWDFIHEPTMNLIGNFSCCLFRTTGLKSMPDFMYETRLNEIAVAFHFDKQGSIGFIKKIMSIYRQHSNGLWTGSDKIAQLRSGLAARKMAKLVAADIYKSAIDEIMEIKYVAPLSESGYTESALCTTDV